MPALSAAGFGELASSMPHGETVAMAPEDDFEPGPLFEVVERKNLVQMVGPATGDVEAPGRFRTLAVDDRERMATLVQLTAPGTWLARTAKLGRFLGFDAHGRLVAMAMAGERLRVAGCTEISVACCHPDWRGKGLAANLMRLVSQAILAQGETPFLHVLAENDSAIGLDERLGFRRRIESRLTILRRSDMTA